jgi:hypothetical protein
MGSFELQEIQEWHHVQRNWAQLVDRGGELGRAGAIPAPDYPSVKCGDRDDRDFAAAFVAVVALNGGFEQAGQFVQHIHRFWDAHRVVAGAGLGIVGWVLTTISLYVNAALIFCVLRCFAGHEPSIRDGLTASFARLPQIIGWAFVAAVMGFVASFIQDTLKEKLGFLGNLLGGLVDFAWAVVTYFVLLVVEGLGPVAAIKRSSALMRQTWGETATGSVGLGALGSAAAVPAVIFIAAGVMMATATGFGGLAPAFFAVAIVYLAGVSLVMGTLGTIFRAGLYVYATTGRAPFDTALMQSAFAPKKAK